MRYDKASQTVLDRADETSWECRIDGPTMRLSIEADGPFKGLVRLPAPTSARQKAGLRWAASEIEKELAPEGVTVRFVTGRG